MGASAGGALALLLSVDRPSLACVMSWAGPTDLASVTTAQQPVLRRPPAPSDEHPPPARHVERGQPRAPGPRPRVPPLRRERPGRAAGTGRGAPSAPAAFDVHRAGAWDVRVRPQRRRRQGVQSRADSRGRSVAFRGRSDALRASQEAVQAVQTPGRGPGGSYPYPVGPTSRRRGSAGRTPTRARRRRCRSHSRNRSQSQIPTRNRFRTRRSCSSRRSPPSRRRPLPVLPDAAAPPEEPDPVLPVFADADPVDPVEPAELVGLDVVDELAVVLVVTAAAALADAPVGTVSGGAPVVSVVAEPLLPQAATTRPRTNAIARTASVRDRLDIVEAPRRRAGPFACRTSGSR